MPASQFCPRCHASASRHYCQQCGLNLRPDRPSVSVGDRESAREREREWLAATTGAAPLGASSTGESATSANAVVRLAYWTQRARFLEHLFREAMTQAEAIHAQCVAAGIGEDEIRRQAGALPRWSSPPSSTATRGAGAAAAPAAAGGFAVAGFYAESGPDLDADGDVDGGLFDKLDQLFGE